MQTLFGQKTEQLQRFLEDGRRVPVTVLRVPEISVTQQKTLEHDGYSAIQVGFGMRKEAKITKPVAGHLKKSGAKTPLFLREIRLANDTELSELGTTIKVEEILEPGDIVWVTGKSKGKGFAGGVKRYGFRGGPKTHGQSDRERAPGSIGQTTTPGRVYKGKRMAGNMGNEQVTIKNILVVSVNPEERTVMLAGLVPGIIGGYVKVVKTGTQKKFSPLLKNPAEQAIADAETAKAEAEAAKALAEAEKIAALEKAKEESLTPTADATTETTEAASPAVEEQSEASDQGTTVEPEVAAVQAEEAETDTTPLGEEAQPETPDAKQSIETPVDAEAMAGRKEEEK
jgi:large subunit ribosomal protein L3